MAAPIIGAIAKGVIGGVAGGKGGKGGKGKGGGGGGGPMQLISQLANMFKGGLA